MKHKPRKPKGSSSKQRQSVRAAPDDWQNPNRWRYRRRALLMLAIALLLPLIWLVAVQFLPAEPAAPAGPVVDVDVARNTVRALGFLHSIGSFILLVGGVAAGFYLWFRMFSESGDWASIVGFISTLAIGTISSAAIWRYGYVPLVDWLWEACGGQMVPYKMHESRASRRLHGVSSYQWGQNAAALTLIGLVGLAYGVAKIVMKDKSSTRR